MKAQLVKAFTSNPQEGNPAGVILNSDHLTEQEMIRIAATLGYSESVFILNPVSSKNDFLFRFMTPTTEVASCGHATLAASQVVFSDSEKATIRIETGSGVVLVNKDPENGFMMQMAKREISSHEYSKQIIANLLRINVDQIQNLPLVTASVGSSKLIIPLQNLDAVQKVDPDFEAMIKFCNQNPVNGFYIFSNQTLGENIDFHARQFNPAAGINEDPITGVAGGALGIYADKYGLSSSKNILIEQGYEVSMPGIIKVMILEDKVLVGGSAVKFGEKQV